MAAKSVSKNTPRARDRHEAEARMIEAVGVLLERGGVEHLGVNAVAQEAKLDKVLIYRYFGGLSALLEAYSRSTDFWPSAEELLEDREELLAQPFAEQVVTLCRRYLEGLRRRPRTLRLLSAELSSDSPFYRTLEDAREAMGMTLLALLAPKAPKGVDVAALMTILAGAVHYLLLRARTVKLFNGIPIAEEEGWERLLAAIYRLSQGLESDAQ